MKPNCLSRQDKIFGQMGQMLCAMMLLLALSKSGAAHGDEVPVYMPTLIAKPSTAFAPLNWSSSSSWQIPGGKAANRVPSSTDIVQIPANAVVQINAATPTAQVVDISGTLLFATTNKAKLKLTAQTIVVEVGGTFTIGRNIGPIPATSTVTVVLGGGTPVGVEGNLIDQGLLIIGNFAAFGTAKSGYARAASFSPQMVTLTAPVTNWQVGDRLALPDTRSPRRRYVESLGADGIAGTADDNLALQQSHSEVVTIASVSADRQLVTFKTPALYEHNNPNGGTFHIGNLSRNVTITTNATDTAKRGHIIVLDPVGAERATTWTGNSASVNVKNVAFAQLGRTTAAPLNAVTNHIGRYALHFHHTIGNYKAVVPVAADHPLYPYGRNPADKASVGGYRMSVVNCAFENDPTMPNALANNTKWQIAIHGSCGINIAQNVFYGAQGAALMTEDGSEGWNDIVGNVAMNCPGGAKNALPDPPGICSLTPAEDTVLGNEGVGFWLSNASNNVSNNVAADCRLAGILVYPHLKYNPDGDHTFDGRSTMGIAPPYPQTPIARAATEFRSLLDTNLDWNVLLYPTALQNNEVYACYDGIELWKTERTRVANTVARNCQIGIMCRYTDLVTIDGAMVRGEQIEGQPTLLLGAKYVAGNVRLPEPINADTNEGHWEIEPTLNPPEISVPPLPTIGIDCGYNQPPRLLNNIDVSACWMGVRLATPRGQGGGTLPLYPNDVVGGPMSLLTRNTTIQDSSFACVVGVYINADQHYKRWSYGPAKTYIRRCSFNGQPGYTNSPCKAVWPVLGSDWFLQVVNQPFSNWNLGGLTNVLAGDEIWIDSYQKNSKANYRAYYYPQHPNMIVPVPTASDTEIISSYTTANFPFSKKLWPSPPASYPVTFVQKNTTNAALSAQTQGQIALAGGVAPPDAQLTSYIGGLVSRVSRVEADATEVLQLDGASNVLYPTVEMQYGNPTCLLGRYSCTTVKASFNDLNGLIHHPMIELYITRTVNGQFVYQDIKPATEYGSDMRCGTATFNLPDAVIKAMNDGTKAKYTVIVRRYDGSNIPLRGGIISYVQP